jgi:predicted Zn finger-like uncharacterized protein
MSLVIQCPHCKAKMSVGEGRLGEQVRCPGCKQQFSAEAKEGARARAKKTTAPRRRTSGKGSKNGPAILLGSLIGGTFLIFCTVVYLANRKPAQDQPRPDPAAGRSQSSGEDSPRTAGKDGKAEPAAPPDPALIDSTFVEAMRNVRRAEDEEPVKTAQALQALKADDRERAEAMMKEVAESPSAALPEYGPALIKMGLTQWVQLTSSKVAREDAEFRNVAKAFVGAGITSTELVMMMGKWCLVPESDRRTLVTAVQENWPPGRLPREVRNAVLMLGGERWLQR